MRRKGGARALLTILLPGLLAACSTVAPVPSGREGLFDKFARMDSPVRAPRARGVDRKTAGAPFAMNDGEEVRLDSAAMTRIRADASTWLWPLRDVRVTSTFGRRNGEFHEGIDLRAKVGTPVQAAQAGRVLYADKRLRGYGRMVVIRHGNGLSTVYAHNSRLLVRAGQKVRRGQLIAISGATGHVRGPHLHFEIRHGVDALNPLALLPVNASQGRSIALGGVASDR